MIDYVQKIIDRSENTNFGLWYNVIMYSTIKINQETKEKLEKFGNMNDTYDSLLERILNHVDSCDEWWNKK